MHLSLSAQKQGVLGISGHAGCGHAHSNDGFVQDDSGGLAAVLAIFQEATGLSLEIRSVRAVVGRNGYFEVETVSGGKGRCSARRGITPHEARLAHYVEGQQAIRTQALAEAAFGRIYGQGAMEPAVALQAAIANAALDSFVRNFPDSFYAAPEGIEGNCGLIAGAVIDFDGIPVSVMGVCNATEGGLGPNEDLEGNACLYGKRPVMEALGLDKLPTFVVEGKVFVLPLCGTFDKPHFVVRAFADDDNIVVAEAYLAALEKLGYPAVYPREALKRVPGALRTMTQRMGEKLADLSQRFASATTSRDKVRAVADLIQVASQDAGGVTFMSDALHAFVGGPGSMPGSSAVLSLFMPQSYIDEYVIPALTEEDVRRYVRVIKHAVPVLHARLDEACDILQKRGCHEKLESYGG